METIVLIARRYFLVAAVVYLFIQITAVNVGQALGPGAFEMGIIVTAIAMLSGIVTACTLAIVDEIRKLGDKISGKEPVK